MMKQIIIQDDEYECDEGTNEQDIEETGKWFYKKSISKAYRKKVLL